MYLNYCNFCKAHTTVPGRLCASCTERAKVLSNPRYFPKQTARMYEIVYYERLSFLAKVRGEFDSIRDAYLFGSEIYPKRHKGVAERMTGFVVKVIEKGENKK